MPWQTVSNFWTRRQILTWAIAGLGAARRYLRLSFRHHPRLLKFRQLPINPPQAGGVTFNPPWPAARFWLCFWASARNGTLVRDLRWSFMVPLQLNSAILVCKLEFERSRTWSPLRATGGRSRRIIFSPMKMGILTVCFHGTHPAQMDGVKPVRHGRRRSMSLMPNHTAHPYHCHGCSPYQRSGCMVCSWPFMVVVLLPMKWCWWWGLWHNNEQQEMRSALWHPNYYRDHPIPIYQNQTSAAIPPQYDWVLIRHLSHPCHMFQVYRGETLTPS